MNLSELIHPQKFALAVLVDPDKYNPKLIELIGSTHADLFLVGGSVLHGTSVKRTVASIKRKSKLPVVLFPGDEKQLCKEADGLLVLSLISGRNPEYLIGKQVKAAPVIRKLKLATLPVAYLLIGNSGVSTTQKVTKTKPLTAIKEICNTVIAAEQLGFRAIYLEAGSGSKKNVGAAIVRKVRSVTPLPLIVGGGIDSPKKINEIRRAGANMVVVGNVLEKYPEKIIEFFNLIV